MKSIKPGRGPSFMNGIVGIVAILFGIFWTVTAAQFAPFMAVFGILWTVLVGLNVFYSFHNATSKNRFSEFDITEGNEEIDPLNNKYSNEETNVKEIFDYTANYCPYCGAKVEKEYKFCKKCGKELPK